MAFIPIPIASLLTDDIIFWYVAKWLIFSSVNSALTAAGDSIGMLGVAGIPGVAGMPGVAGIPRVAGMPGVIGIMPDGRPMRRIGPGGDIPFAGGVRLQPTMETANSTKSVVESLRMA